ncbi:alpha/beta fold hydrolase [Sphingosinicella sp. BN140058]|uniref:alpha/beta fold hydrolase n=1 Tax=Sphingosinicella sp. BN140058 TaxID=1892855 RepID=UPI0010105B45|nr:alpha/beta hydrolase [Sphingosinicella sp. BN140058]QAY78476.1 alpha/beta hydrolase [Sphingosinicella sp. BN140058]
MRLGVLAASVLSMLSTIGFSQVPASPLKAVAPETGRAFAEAHSRVDIGGGRRLNLYCTGSGDQTVLFDAGGSDWSVVWALVQPAISAQARACSYDRAGLGRSDPAAGPRTPVAIAEDLHALIAAAELKTPLVLVGHSLGGFNVKLYAALYPEDVAGLVLVDPAEERSGERSRSLLRSRYGDAFAARSELLDLTALGGIVERYRGCAERAREQELDPTTIAYRRCADPERPALGPDIAVARRRIQVTPAYQAAQASEIANSVYGNAAADPVYAGLFRAGRLGKTPVIVLTHGRYDAADPLDAAGQASGLALHAETASLSKLGRHRVVPDTGHYIQLDAPDAVIAAIREVLAR